MTSNFPHHTKKIVVEEEEEDDDEVDPVDEMIKRTGCTEQHNAVQDCIFDHKDWRKCQAEVKNFKDCYDIYTKAKEAAFKKSQ